MKNYTLEQRNNAKNKINKLLALANDKAATDNEKSTALQMAKKLADKYGFSIVSGRSNSNNNSTNSNADIIWNKYTVKMYDKKLVDWILAGAGYLYIVGKDYFEVRGSFDINAFSKIYKEIFKSYEKALKFAKDDSFKWERKDSVNFKKIFCVGIYQGFKEEYNEFFIDDYAYESGYDLGIKYKSFRKEAK